MGSVLTRSKEASDNLSLALEACLRRAKQPPLRVPAVVRHDPEQAPDIPRQATADGGVEGAGEDEPEPGPAGRPGLSSAATAGAERAAPPISATATAVVTIRRMVPLVLVISQATLTRRGHRSAMCSMIAVVEMAGVRSR